MVSTNYTSKLRAGPHRVFPIDIALVGIEVPAGRTTIELAPAISIPVWTRILQLLGVAGFLALCLARRR